jgi:hypothetical protein
VEQVTDGQKSALVNQLRNKAVEQTTLSSPLRMARRRLAAGAAFFTSRRQRQASQSVGGVSRYSNEAAYSAGLVNDSVAGCVCRLTKLNM